MSITDDEFFGATAELSTVKAWARARYAAPKATLGAVLLRVAASTEPGVQLPGVIGGPASLNLGIVFASKSGGGKGISDKVGRLAWPADIIERPIGSGEGIAAMFAPPKKEGAQPITRAILSVPEIDTLAGVAGRQGSILLPQLKSALMGELLGQSNASEATTRIVQAHAYRCCLSIGAQPGHADVIFNDTTGGTPQRLIWLPTTDPDMPAEQTPDPEPLDTAGLPAWARTGTVITYGPAIIKDTIIDAHLARQRGEGDALDGHALLTRCKVAANLAILHHRSVVSDLDWELSGTVMQWSNTTRDWILEQARIAARAKVRDRAISRVTFDEIIDERHRATVRSRILRLLSTGPMSRSDLRRAMGKQHYREAFDALLPHLEKISQIITIPGEKAPHYALNPEFTGEPEFTPEKASSAGVNHQFTGEPTSTVTGLDSRRSHESDHPSLTAREWFAHHIAELQMAGNTTTTSFAVMKAGEAAGFTRNNLRQAASAHPDVRTIDRKGGTATWSIEPGRQVPEYTSAAQWLDSWLDRQDASTVQPAEVRIAGESAGHPWHSVRRAAGLSPRIESIPAHGDARTERIWKIVPGSLEAGA